MADGKGSSICCYVMHLCTGVITPSEGILSTRHIVRVYRLVACPWAGLIPRWPGLALVQSTERLDHARRLRRRTSCIRSMCVMACSRHAPCLLPDAGKVDVTYGRPYWIALSYAELRDTALATAARFLARLVFIIINNDNRDFTHHPAPSHRSCLLSLH